ncbi:hypothetical protein MXMO3_00460 [Maritalea myrionectae]|uniref:Uncharacterized protein n=1 Tax=Maritalea myrionectae TaxID=454601 RepID=A0A2R4MAV6_9HYPH|nr:hypothetical protein [Maritalea myrionectae]AVX03006.1 hypothetical protein MXMO3_00460 [Maritalea myrionectae]
MNNTSSVARLRWMTDVAAAMAMISLALLILITVWGAYTSFYQAKNLPTFDGKLMFVAVVFGSKLWLQMIGLLLLYIVPKCVHLFLDMYVVMARTQQD